MNFVVNLDTARKLYPIAREAGIPLTILDSRLQGEMMSDDFDPTVHSYHMEPATLPPPPFESFYEKVEGNREDLPAGVSARGLLLPTELRVCRSCWQVELWARHTTDTTVEIKRTIVHEGKFPCPKVKAEGGQ